MTAQTETQVLTAYGRFSADRLTYAIAFSATDVLVIESATTLSRAAIAAAVDLIWRPFIFPEISPPEASFGGHIFCPSEQTPRRRPRGRRSYPGKARTRAVKSSPRASKFGY